jgi:hypothetical protein
MSWKLLQWIEKAVKPRGSLGAATIQIGMYNTHLNLAAHIQYQQASIHISVQTNVFSRIWSISNYAVTWLLIK